MQYRILEAIDPMLAEYAAGEKVYDEILSAHGGSTLAELKYDGYRMQLHKKGDIVMGFTRNLNEVPLGVYPELQSSIARLPDCVLDCELNGGIGHGGFKVVKGRFRHKATSMDEYKKKADLNKKLELRVFDTLCFEGKWLMELPLTERRVYTENISERKIKPSRQWKVNDAKKLEELFEGLIANKNEGLVCKRASSLYVPGYRGEDWAKLKKFETLDLAILGFYMADEEISQLLCGTFNPETRQYETLAKVNAKREGMNKELIALLGSKMQEKKPVNVSLHPKIKDDKRPQYFIQPSETAVVEVKAMNIQYTRNWHSCGLNEEGKSYSLRIAWLKQVREDKKPEQAMGAKDIEKLYRMQEE